MCWISLIHVLKAVCREEPAVSSKRLPSAGCGGTYPGCCRQGLYLGNHRILSEETKLLQKYRIHLTKQGKTISANSLANLVKKALKSFCSKVKTIV